MQISKVKRARFALRKQYGAHAMHYAHTKTTARSTTKRTLRTHCFDLLRTRIKAHAAQHMQHMPKRIAQHVQNAHGAQCLIYSI